MKEDIIFYGGAVTVLILLIGALVWATYSDVKQQARCESECKEYAVVQCDKRVTVCRTDGGGLRAVEVQ